MTVASAKAFEITRKRSAPNRMPSIVSGKAFGDLGYCVSSSGGPVASANTATRAEVARASETAKLQVILALHSHVLDIPELRSRILVEHFI